MMLRTNSVRGRSPLSSCEHSSGLPVALCRRRVRLRHDERARSRARAADDGKQPEDPALAAGHGQNDMVAPRRSYSMVSAMVPAASVSGVDPEQPTMKRKPMSMFRFALTAQATVKATKRMLQVR